MNVAVVPFIKDQVQKSCNTASKIYRVHTVPIASYGRTPPIPCRIMETFCKEALLLADNMECLWLCYMESQGLCVPSFRLLAWLGGVLYGRLHSHFRNITYIPTV